MIPDHRLRIETFDQLHRGEGMLFLGNAWDLWSAIALEKAGFHAIGTTSWGIAHSLGFPDGEHMDFDTHLGIIRRIAAHVSIPVSADIEAGYSDDPDIIVENVLRTAEAGAAGINLEDSLKQTQGLKDIEEHAQLLTRIREALDKHGYGRFYINTRIDTYFQREDPLAETITRAQAYVAHGASGVFVPGVRAEADIRAIVAGVDAPVNVLSLPGLTNCARLAEWGVRRFSFGNAFSDKMVEIMEQTASRVFAAQDTSCFHEEWFPS